MPHPDEFTCEQYGELAQVLTEGMHYSGCVWVELSDWNVALLRCNWKSEPSLERVQSAPSEVEIWVRSNDFDSETLWRSYQAGADKKLDRYTRWESELVESLGGVVFGDPFERNGAQPIAELPGVAVDVLHECTSELEAADGNCTNAPAAFTSDNAVDVLERIVSAITESSWSTPRTRSTVTRR